MNEADKRRELGAKKVGAPVNEVRDAIARLASMEEYQQIRFDAVEFYSDRFLCRELISLIDETWDLAQLEAIDSEVVKVVFLMLLRDMMQQHRATIVKDAQTQNWDTQRIEQFIVGLFYEAQAPIQPYQDWLEVVQSHDEEPSTTLITGLAQQIAVDPKMLFLYHMTACDVTGEDVLS